jgi:TetR/AcrR family transcriptional regulator
MNRGNTTKFEQAHLSQWLETSRQYLFPDGKTPVALATTPGVASSQSETGQRKLKDANTATFDADPAENASPQLHLDSHGAQDRFISRARGKLLRLVKGSARQDQSPLQELEQVFYFQAMFVTQHPDIPGRLLGWLSQRSDSRIRRRIQRVIGHYESRLASMIERGKHQGLIRANIDPPIAARIFIGMIQRLALRVNANLRQRERLLREAFESFARYRAAMALPSK